MSEEQVIEVFNEVKKYFIYQSDEITYNTLEDWRSHKNLVEAKVEFRDDCDGFAITCGDIIHTKNIVAGDKVSVAACSYSGKLLKPNHAVCLVYLPDKTLVLDHWRSFVMDFRDVNYYWYYDRPFNNTGQARDLTQENA